MVSATAALATKEEISGKGGFIIHSAVTATGGTILFIPLVSHKGSSFAGSSAPSTLLSTTVG